MKSFNYFLFSRSSSTLQSKGQENFFGPVEDTDQSFFNYQPGLLRNKFNNRSLNGNNIGKSSATIQKKCSECTREEEILQGKLEANGSNDSLPPIESGIIKTRSSGKQLPSTSRNRMESSMNADFSKVKIHDDDQSADFSKKLNAQAFTHGRDIYFANGKYNPATEDGNRLLAHELTHVIQQSGSNARIQKAPDPPASDAKVAVTGPDENLDTSVSGLIGLVNRDKSPKLRLRSDPDTTQEWNVLETLEFNTKLELLGQLSSGWYKVRSPLNNVGYVATPYVFTNLPDKETRLHRVETGVPGYAISIAEKYYKSIVLPNLDLGDYVEMLAFVNDGWIPAKGWKDVHFNPERFIKIPGAHYAQQFLAGRKGYSLKSWIFDQFDGATGLDEEALGEYLFKLMVASESNYQLITDIVNYLEDDDEDEVSSAFVMKAKSPIDPDKPSFTWLDKMMMDPQGALLVDILYYAVATGYITEEDQEAATYLLAAKAAHLPVEKVAKEMEEPMIFPLKQTGITVFDPAPLSAEKTADGYIIPDYPVAVANDYPEDIAAIRKHGRGDPILKEIKLSPDEIVGVKLYDEGEIIHYVPASGLILYSNKTTTETIKKIGEVSALGLGGIGGLGIKGAGWLGKTLIWADRIATAIEVIAMVVNEHKGWIIKNFPNHGKEFINALNTVNTIASIYSVGRLVSGIGYIAVRGLKSKWTNWKNEAASNGLAGNKIVKDIDANAQTLVQSAEGGRLEVLKKNPGRPYKSLPDDEIEKLIKTGDEAAMAESINRSKLNDYKTEDEFLAYSKGKKSTELDVVDAKVELELAQKGGEKKILTDDPDFSEEILFNGHTWKRNKNKPHQWCRFSDGELCYLFGEGEEGISVRFFGRKGEVIDKAELLRANMPPPPTAAPGWQAHHIIPYELRNHPVIDFLRRKFASKWNINDAQNGIWLPAKRDVPGAGKRSLHRGNHEFYTGVVETRLDELNYKWTRNILSDDDLFLEVTNLQVHFSTLLDNGSLPLAR